MKLDDNFLADVGLQGMPEEQKKAFLEQAQEELEIRVGEKMSEGMSQAQIEEFEGIMQNDQEVIRRLIMEMKQDFRQDEIYQKLLNRYGVEQGDWKILGEYLSVKWIQKNRPDYREIVKSEIERMTQEIRESREQILDGAKQG